jgi:thiosulfate/3-mercaptopyruvate sulfurtransferase
MIKLNLSRNHSIYCSHHSNRHLGIQLLFYFGIIIIFFATFTSTVNAGCACSGGDNWDPTAFLNSESGVQPATSSSTQLTSTNSNAKPDVNSAASMPKAEDRTDSFPNGDILKPIKSVSSFDVVVDVSNGDGYTTDHIKNAIHIPTRSFLDESGNLKEKQELALVLGNSGISRDDSVVLYGTSESSGEAEFAYWVLSYLGQNEIALIDGSLADWKAAGLPIESSENKRGVVVYEPDINSTVLAEYDYVKSGQAQIADVRPFTEFSSGRIIGSTAMDPSNIIKGDMLKDANDLDMVFGRLSKDKPVVVYSDDYSRSSLVWFALQLMGYESSIYTWEDWKEHEFKDVKEGTAPPVDKSASASKYKRLGRT